ncbi:MAG: 4Fe-4S binding protein [Methanobrevibacter sp.]|nr:4Fe-4S binding protein [Candidatus Methanovirga australis]
MIVKDWCMYCGECAGICPRNLILLKETELVFDDSKCRECNICIEICPINALEK